MPFDATRHSIEETLGVVPIPITVLAEHKRKMRDEFFANPENRGKLFAQWTEVGDTLLTKYSYEMFDWIVRSQIFGATPNAVKTVVQEAERRANIANLTATKVFGYFYEDPYILLRFDDDLSHDICLAIWNKGEVIHLATLI